MTICIPDSHPHRITNTKCRINTVVSPDDGPIVGRNIYRLINILRINFSPSWFYLKGYLYCSIFLSGFENEFGKRLIILTNVHACKWKFSIQYIKQDGTSADNYGKFLNTKRPWQVLNVFNNSIKSNPILLSAVGSDIRKLFLNKIGVCCIIIVVRRTNVF
jgi:hypothetical protein